MSQLLYDTKTTREKSHVDFACILNQAPPKQLKHVRLGFRVIALKRWNQLIYLWNKVVCLFSFVLYWWDPLNQDASHHVLGLFGKLSRRRGALAWFHGIWTSGVEVLEYWKISTLKIKLNPSWNFGKNWNVGLLSLERSWWAGFNRIYLVRFGFKMWEILFLNDFCCWRFK
jgi:hypothetical protein